MAVRIRFVTDPKKDWVSRAIRSAELGRWPSHCEAVLADGTRLGAHMDGGVAIRPKGYDDAYNPVDFIVDLPATAEQELAFFAFLKAQLGKAYDIPIIEDFIGGVISGQAQERDWRQDNQWICSELMAAALIEAGIIDPFPGGSLCVTPWELYIALSQHVDLSEAVPQRAKALVAVEAPLKA